MLVYLKFDELFVFGVILCIIINIYYVFGDDDELVIIYFICRFCVVMLARCRLLLVFICWL